ncbi:MAG: DUF3801 domain-containing protein [Subdoligranulum sp.]
MNYGSEPADQVVRYSLEGAEFALRISGTVCEKLLYFRPSRIARQPENPRQNTSNSPFEGAKTLKFFTVDKDRMHDFARAAKAHGLLFCPIRDKMDPDHIEIAILQDDASKANRIIEKLQLDVVDTGTAELVDAVQQNLENAAPTMRTRPPWIFLWARRTPVRPSLSPTAANLLQTRRRRAPICFEPRVSAPASEWNCRILPPTCETEQRHPKTVCPSCR